MQKFLDFCERNLRWLLPAIGICAALLTVGIFAAVRASVPAPVKLSYITASYEGDTNEGTVLDSENRGFIVTAHFDDGTTEAVKGWRIEEPQTLKKDSDSTVVIIYENASTQCTVHCTTGYISSITAEYDGSTEAGTSLDNTNPGIHVYAIRSTGEKAPLERGWRVVKPAILAKNTTTTIQIAYEDLLCTLSVKCSTREIQKLTAVYTGSTEEGTFIGSGCKDLTVTAQYSDGESEEITGWTLKENVTLMPGERYLLEVHYRDAVCIAEVVCTSPTLEEYAAGCADPGYASLRFFPSSHVDKKVVVSGKLQEIRLQDDGSVMLTLEVQADLMGFVYRQVLVRYTSTLHGELPPAGSSVNVYGTFNGLYDGSSDSSLVNAPFIEGEYVVSTD